MFDQHPDFNFSELLQFFRQTKIIILQGVLVSAGLLCVVVGMWRWSTAAIPSYQDTQSEQLNNDSASGNDTHHNQSSDIWLSEESLVVDVSGAVERPGIYSVEPGSRVGQLLDVAGGLRSDADTVVIAQSINLSQQVVDQQKIYIPFQGETVVERNTTRGGNVKTSSNNTTGISVNTASASELESLPGIGPKRAEVIIENRPYAALDALVQKGSLTQSIYDDIKDMIQL